jgi:hypothetical protein
MRQFLTVIAAMAFGALIGISIERVIINPDPPLIYSMSGDEINHEIDVFRMCMQSAGATGCRMQVHNFDRYMRLKRELVNRIEAEALAAASADAAT